MNLVFCNKTSLDLDKYYDLYETLFVKTFKILNLSTNYTMGVNIISTQMIHKLNLEYRNIDRPTDVISFAFLDDKSEIINNGDMDIDLGEIYICYNVAKRNAAKYGNSIERELCFLFVHGLLHLLGYNHIKKEDEEVMFALQDKILPPKEKNNE